MEKSTLMTIKLGRQVAIIDTKLHHKIFSGEMNFKGNLLTELFFTISR